MVFIAAAALWAADTVPPRVEYKVDPKYTQEAVEAKFEGTCLLEVHIDVEGRVRKARIVKPVGYGLDENAIEAVRQWRFRAAKRDGKPVEAVATVGIAYRLEDMSNAKEDQ